MNNPAPKTFREELDKVLELYDMKTCYTATRYLKTFEKSRDALVDRVEGLEKWIDVKDEMPEDNKCVLAYDAEDFGCMEGYFSGKWYLAGAINKNVTHWKPLPENPWEKI